MNHDAVKHGRIESCDQWRRRHRPGRITVDGYAPGMVPTTLNHLTELPAGNSSGYSTR